MEYFYKSLELGTEDWSKWIMVLTLILAYASLVFVVCHFVVVAIEEIFKGMCKLFGR
jgi:hypothetical protein